MLKYILGVVVAVTVLIFAALFYWFNVAQNDEPAPLTITTLDNIDDEALQKTINSIELNGKWITTDGSLAGYRVIEDFEILKDQTAVGRTSEVDGTLTIKDFTIESAEFTIDVASITSDRSQRDNVFRGDVMEADTYPTAKLVVTEPIKLSTDLTKSQTASIKGELTLKDTTKPVEFDVQGQINNEKNIEIAAKIQINFADYGIDAPSNPFVQVKDTGTIEAQLIFTKS